MSTPTTAPGHDVVIVGAGAAGTYTLLGLLGELVAAPPAEPVDICVVERDPQPFAGVPYGRRAARHSLLITPLSDFLPEAERARFSTWLAANKDWAFDEYRTGTGELSRRWWARHAAEIERDEFDPLYLPRYLFGSYLSDRVGRAVADARTAGVATVRVLTDEVDAIRPTAGGYTVACRRHSLTAARVVLSTGSPATMSRLRVLDSEDSAVLLDDPFDDLPAALEQVRAALRDADPAARPHVVVLGGNASTMDVVYQVTDVTDEDERRALVTVLSPRGELPAKVDPSAAPATEGYEPSALALGRAPVVRAEAVHDAAVADIARGADQGLSSSDTLVPVSRAVIGLLPRLSAGEAAAFAGRWGAELGRYQRRAGWEYWEAVEELATAGRLQLLPASFAELTAAGRGRSRVRYQQDGTAHDLEPAATVVVNCAGPAKDLSVSAPPLVGQLVAEGVCRLTAFGAGIHVDDTFQAAPGLHVMGPLLAGNVLDGSPLWHMEHAGRISAYGSLLGRAIAADLVPSTA
jgi:uncharacterized NAD(P)/FAD-binding protein YdhS